MWCGYFYTSRYITEALNYKLFSITQKPLKIQDFSLISSMVEQDTSNIQIQVQVLDKNSPNACFSEAKGNTI